MTDTLTYALPREIARVTAKRDRWIKMAHNHPAMASGNVGRAQKPEGIQR